MARKVSWSQRQSVDSKKHELGDQLACTSCGGDTKLLDGFCRHCGAARAQATEFEPARAGIGTEPRPWYMNNTAWTVVAVIAMIWTAVGFITAAYLGSTGEPDVAVEQRSAQPQSPTATPFRTRQRATATPTRQPAVAGPKTWHRVGAWSGTGTKNTEPFTANSPWCINWSCRAGESGAGSFRIWVHDATTGERLDLVANVMGSVQDQSYVYKSGQFYLSISGTLSSYNVVAMSLQ